MTVSLYYALRKKNDKKTSGFNDLFLNLLQKVYERGAFFQ